MTGHSRHMWAMVMTVLMVLMSLSAVIGRLPAERPEGSEKPIAHGACYGGSSERTTVMEVFTATWCKFCPTQAFSNNRLYDELGHERFIVLEHHASATGLIYLPESSTRMSMYGATGYPTGIMDGGGYYSGDANANGQGGATLWSSGGTSKWQRYLDNRDMFEAERNRNANLTISLTGNLTSSEGKVLAHIEATDDITETNLKVKFMVYESNIYRPPHGSGEAYMHHRVYNHVVRAILPDYTVPATFDQAGDTLDVERTFTIDNSWDIRSLGIAVMVQTDNSIDYMYIPSMSFRHNYPILQAAAMDYVPTGLILVDGDDGDDLATSYDNYDEILTKKNIPHDGWDTHESRVLDTESDDARTMPQYGNISSYPGMIWFTGDDLTTLSTSSRSTISSYLNDKGNLLMMGEEIANDAQMGGWTTWLSDNLHASFIADNSGETFVNGIASDPITDGLADLTVSGTSPDVVATSGSTEIFVYSPSGTNIAGIRADHDSDSRVVYNAFNFFEGTDTEDFDLNDELLMERILDWLNGASPPFVDILQPDGGEVWAKSTQYDILWYANDVEMPETPVTIEYTTDSLSPTWVAISTGEPNDGHYLWTTPNVDSVNCRVRVCAIDSVGMTNCVMSEADFTIGTPPADNLSPSIFSARLNGMTSLTVNPGDPATLTAIVSDTQSNIGGANYTIDGSPGGPLSAQDGVFDEKNETVTALIDTTGWTEAIYTICVTDAYDSAGNVNTTQTACSYLNVTLTPIDNDPPEIYNVLVDGQPSVTVPQGASISLTASARDMTKVQGMNYTVGIMNWPGILMTPVDGAFDEPYENASTPIDTTGWVEGNYDVCVYAWDSLGYYNTTGACAEIIISSDIFPPMIYDVFINGLPTQSWKYDLLPPDFFLTAVIDDTATGNSVIEEANYTLGPSNWPGTKMFPVDMVYNSPYEDVQQIATTPTQPGTYEFCVYGFDVKNNINWTGSCATLYIIDPDPPAVLNVLINGSKSTTVILGDPVTLEATIDDTGTGNSLILSANYTDGVANWPSSSPMLPTDASFDSPLEDVSVLIDTSTWSLGLHTICVYAQDEWGNMNLTSADCVEMELVAIGPQPPIMLDAQLSGAGLADVLVSWQASGDDGAGLDNVVQYEVYMSDSYHGPYNLVTTVPATDQQSYDYLCIGCGYGDPSSHFFYVRAFNGLEYSSSPNMAGKFVRHLTAGVNLVSIPLITSDTSVDGVLQTVQFDKVWTYDALDLNDPWKWYEEVKPYKGDLHTIDHAMAFWVNVLVEDDFVVAGLVPTATQMQLKAGWNLVSFPSFNLTYTVGQFRSEVGALDVEGYDPTAPYCLVSLSDSDIFVAGMAFWVYLSADIVWNVLQ